MWIREVILRPHKSQAAVAAQLVTLALSKGGGRKGIPKSSHMGKALVSKESREPLRKTASTPTRTNQEKNEVSWT